MSSSRFNSDKEVEDYVLILMISNYHFCTFTLAELAGTTEAYMYNLCERLLYEHKVKKDEYGRYYKLMERA